MSDYDPNRPPAPPGQPSWSPQPAPAAPPQYPAYGGYGDPAPAPSAGVQSTMHEMTEQLQTVIDAAERAAEAIRGDAEDQARQQLVEAQRKADQLTAERVSLISDLTDDLIRHAETVKLHSEQMVRALEDAITSVTTKLDQPGFREPLGSGAGTSYGDSSTSYAPISPAEPAYEPPPAEPPPSAPSEGAYPPPPAYEPPAYEPPPYQAPPAAAPPPPPPTGQPMPAPPPPPEPPAQPDEPTSDDEGSGNVFRPGGY